MAVVAPIPRARVRIVVTAKPGLLRSWRMVKRMEVVLHSTRQK
jgi:hypothetical protein